MPPSETAPGQQRAWTLLEKLGEGDAGEVYRVESLLDRKTAILKRPRRSAFPSEIIRQATQIQREGEALSALARLERTGLSLRTPTLLDQGKTGTEFSESYFIVITPAPGIDLASLARAVRLGSPDPDGRGLPARLSPAGQAFLNGLVQEGRLPELLLLRAFSGLIEFFESLHIHRFTTPAGRYHGLIWNDVKIEHIFWYPDDACLTVIDWGNAQLLEADGTSKDRAYSRMDDYRQFIGEIGRFLRDAAPDLAARLAWPDEQPPGSIYSLGILPLKERLAAELESALARLRATRRQESDLLQSAEPNMDEFQTLGQVQRQIILDGEMPDFSGSARFVTHLAYSLAEQGRMDDFRRLCRQGQEMLLEQPQKCALLHRMADEPEDSGLPAQAMLYLLNDDWFNALWELRRAAQRQPEPHWWEELSTSLSSLATGTQVKSPYVAANRLLHALQAAAQGASDPTPYNDLLITLRDEILPRWMLLEPDPPDAGLAYSEVERLLETATAILPEAARGLSAALHQPQAHIQIILDSWIRQDFETARRALRQALVWDPQRQRVLLADRAMQETPAWLGQVRGGPKKDEPLQDFVTRLELNGREIRHRTGAAPWLDALLAAFSQLRKGIDPTEVLMQNPLARDELAWLLVLEPRRPLLASPDKPVRLERQTVAQTIRPTLFGQKEVPLGPEKDFTLSEPMDTWVPEARGSSARVFLGRLRGLSGEARQAAVKVMRPDQAAYALPLFREEVRILTLLRDVPGVNPMLECGFLRLDTGVKLPGEDRSLSAGQLTGLAQRFGPDSVHNFLGDLEKKAAQEWIPYIALEIQDRAGNLLLQCDTGYTRGRFLPTLDGLRMAIQICDILAIAHDRDIVYRDHKILHYYWQDVYNGVFMVDWNIARRYPEGLSEADVQFDLVQFAARALHYILTGRSAPGALPLGPNRPEEIEAAARSYTAQWTYDDQRLPKDIKDILERSLAGEYSDARKLRDALLAIFQRLAELINPVNNNH